MKDKGFTLLEIAVVGFLVVIVGAAVVGLQYIFTESQLTTWQSYLNIDQANSNVTQIVREIRNSSPSETGAYLLETAGDNEIVFYSDVDFDGFTERIRYTLNGEVLEKGITEPEGFPSVTYPNENEKVNEVATTVKNAGVPIFYYFNESWPQDTANNPLAADERISETRMVSIFLRLNTQDDPKSDYILESYAQMRSLKNNL